MEVLFYQDPHAGDLDQRVAKYIVDEDSRLKILGVFENEEQFKEVMYKDGGKNLSYYKDLLSDDMRQLFKVPNAEVADQPETLSEELQSLLTEMSLMSGKEVRDRELNEYKTVVDPEDVLNSNRVKRIFGGELDWERLYSLLDAAKELGYVNFSYANDYMQEVMILKDPVADSRLHSTAVLYATDIRTVLGNNGYAAAATDAIIEMLRSIYPFFHSKDIESGSLGKYFHDGKATAASAKTYLDMAAQMQKQKQQMVAVLEAIKATKVQTENQDVDGEIQSRLAEDTPVPAVQHSIQNESDVVVGGVEECDIIYPKKKKKLQNRRQI